MKRMLVLVLVATMAASAFAQTQDKEPSAPISEDLVALQTANSLARYGYSTDSASALIGAAEIFAQIRTQPLGIEPTRSQSSGSATVSTPEFTPANLLRDARRLARNNNTLLAWATEVERTLNTQTRGAAGGPRFAREVIVSGANHNYTFTFRAGERADITLVGNGVSDLDLYIYDENGNLIRYDEGYSDVASLWFIPAWTGRFTVRVKNWGNIANRYELYTN